MKNIKNKILRVLYVLLLTALVSVVLLLLATKLPIPGNWQVYIVQSGSMEPTINTGSIVVVKPVSEYHAGDIITFSRNRAEIPVTHRIIELVEQNGRQQFSTRGDANKSADMETISQRQILGKVRFNIPYLGYGIAAVKQPLGFLFVIIIPALLIVWEEATKIVKEIKKRKEEHIN